MTYHLSSGAWVTIVSKFRVILVPNVDPLMTSILLMATNLGVPQVYEIIVPAYARLI